MYRTGVHSCAPCLLKMQLKVIGKESGQKTEPFWIETQLLRHGGSTWLWAGFFPPVRAPALFCTTSLQHNCYGRELSRVCGQGSSH